MKTIEQFYNEAKGLSEKLNTGHLTAQGTFVRRAEYICQESACRSCGTCMDICPTKAIFYHRSYPVIDPCLCSDCGWCEEHCPAGAILRTVQLTPV